MKRIFTLILILVVSLQVQSQVFSEDFEGGSLPEGWTNQSNATDGGWLIGTNLSSGAFPIPAHTNYAGTNDDACNCDKSNENLITPTFSIPEDEIYVISFEYFFVDGDYDADETAKVMISNDSATSWTELSELAGVDNWTGMSISLDQYSGQTVSISFRYDDGGGWNYGLTVDDIIVESLVDYNFVANEVNVPEIYTTEDGGLVISTEFMNNGAIEVTSLMMNYQVDDEEVVSAMVDGLSIGTFETLVVEHPTPYSAMELGNKSITAWATSVNGEADVNSNEVSGVSQITDQHSMRTGLSETFTSNTCPPCAGFNPPYQAELDELETNNGVSNYVAVKYQVDWPAPGNDVCYNSDIQSRISYYGVTGVPNTIVESIDADYNYSYVSQTWDDAADNTSLQFQDLTDQYGWVAIEATYVFNENYELSVEVELTPNANFDAGSQTLQVAVINNYYDDTEISPNGTNGETEWEYVVRKMLPNGNGTELDALTTGNPVTFYTDYPFEMGSVSQGSFSLVNDDIKVVVWVQDNNSRKIRNAALADNVTGIDESNKKVSLFNVFPNPAQEQTNVSMHLNESNEVSLQVVNMVGKVVYSENKGTLPSGDHLFTLDVTDFENGLYLFNVQVGDQLVTKKISVNR